MKKFRSFKSKLKLNFLINFNFKLAKLKSSKNLDNQITLHQWWLTFFDSQHTNHKKKMDGAYFWQFFSAKSNVKLFYLKKHSFFQFL